MSITYYPRPEILAGDDHHRGHTVIEASAGTGKTFTLEHLVLDLLIGRQAEIEQILVVTFTDAATRELRGRIRALIRAVCDEGLKKPEPGRGKSRYWEIDRVTRDRLREALFRFDGAAIATIHGFCQRILSEQAFLGGRLFQQEHAHGQEMFGLAFREEVRQAVAEANLTGVALRRWIERERSLQKVQDLLYRCHREGCPDRCPVTPQWDLQGFLDAAGRLPSLETLLDTTDHYFQNRYLKQGYQKLFRGLFDFVDTFEPGPSLFETVPPFVKWAGGDCTINKVRQTRVDHINGVAAATGAPPELEVLAGCLDQMMLRAISEPACFVHRLLPRVQARLDLRKRALGLIDYDDMLLGVREALVGENAPVLLDGLRRRWKYALVDEFQDTDPVQWEIFRRIFVDGTEEQQLCIIGDPKQAIYGFRGADVHTYGAARDYLLVKNKATRLPLLKNYRSTAALIAAVNAILTATDDNGTGFFDGLNRYDEPVQWGDATRAAFENGKAASPVHLVHLCGAGAGLSAASLRRGLANFIAQEIQSLTNPQTALTTIRRGEAPVAVKYNDIYILTRSGWEGRQIGLVLRRYGIPHAFYKLDGLFATDEAQDIHRLLLAIAAPEDPAARMAAWLTPFFGVPLEELPCWQDAAAHHPLAARLLRWNRLADAREWARLFDDILTNSGLMRRLIFSAGERELTNYMHLFELLLAEVHAHPVSLLELARGLKARIDGRKMPEGREGDLQRLETDKDAVQILTMHKAKGLEAEVVFIAGGFSNPPGDSLQANLYHRGYKRCLHLGRATGKIAAAIEAETRQENQRLAYVALTRAGARLYLPYFGPAPNGDGTNDCHYGFPGLGDFYRPLQEQLNRLRDQGRFGDGEAFVLRQTPCRVRMVQEPTAPAGRERRLEERLLEPLPTKATEAKEIKARRRGVLLTSYTRIKQGQGWQAPCPGEDAEADRRNEEVAGEAPGDPGLPGPDLVESPAPQSTLGLPGGRETGIFLHALLEETTATELAGQSFESWSAQPALQARATAIARRHGFAETDLAAALELVYRAFRTPLRVQNLECNFTLEMPGGIASGEHLRPEMSFIFPIPEHFHPLLHGRPGSGAAADYFPFRAWRGYIRGLIDLVFEHRGRIYLLDWKSDSLTSFDADRIRDHVEAHYRLQAQLYLLAVVRLLGLKTGEEYGSHFGGVLYLFLRGLGRTAGGSAAGVWFSRPPWEEVLALEQELLNRREWGGSVVTDAAKIVRKEAGYD